MKNITLIIAYYIFSLTILKAPAQIPPVPAKVSTNQQQSYAPTSEIKKRFTDTLPPSESVVYTIVPRGLILSIDSRTFFNAGNDELLESSKPVLEKIAQTLKLITNNCIIESNTENDSWQNSNYESNWELSTVRAGKIADYLIKEQGIHPGRISAIGFGELMPFYTYIEHSKDLDRRIDFVIINYDNTGQ